MGSLNLHKIGAFFQSKKSIEKRKRKESRHKASKKIAITRHGEDRIVERLNKKSKVRVDIISAIEQGRCEIKSTYRVHGDNGIYLLSHDLKLITVLSKNMKLRDKFYNYLDKDQRKYLLKKINTK